MKTEAQIRSALVGKVLEMPANKALSDLFLRGAWSKLSAAENSEFK